MKLATSCLVTPSKKSVTVQYIDISMPDKRSRCIKNYETLKDIEEKMSSIRGHISAWAY